MIRRYKAINISVFVLFILLGLALSTVAQELVVSEIMGIHSEERMLFSKIFREISTLFIIADCEKICNEYLLH